jgi:GNAT superfamily N-acetyltransferase
LITHFLGPDEIAGYACDLADRLLKLDGDFPRIWYLLGKSGQAFADVLIDQLPTEKQKALRFIRVTANRDTGRIRFHDSIVKSRLPVLLLDSAVHSGKSMLNVAQAIARMGTKDIISYSLVLKRGSVIVPNYFGVIVEETDRCLFQLPAIPNNRLCERRPFGVLRELASGDTNKRFIRTGETAIDDTTFSSLLYEKERGSHVYVYEHGNKICGVLSFAVVDLVASDKKYHGKGIGGAMMRWAETWARSRKHGAVELWAIKRRIDFYTNRRFKLIGREINLAGTRFFLMRRELLYNLSFVDPLEDS